MCTFPRCLFSDEVSASTKVVTCSLETHQGKGCTQQPSAKVAPALSCILFMQKPSSTAGDAGLAFRPFPDASFIIRALPWHLLRLASCSCRHLHQLLEMQVLLSILFPDASFIIRALPWHLLRLASCSCRHLHQLLEMQVLLSVPSLMLSAAIRHYLCTCADLHPVHAGTFIDCWRCRSCFPSLP